ncbi:MAG: cytochrome c biogenesis protein CcsA [Acidobacteriota bacterium]|jgi:ABC-type transport system involved in cytochrome c biogenesis permease subunit|nr:cytochrome c biogenesis protein CcsA [Acidobacteriota bacterium]
MRSLWSHPALFITAILWLAALLSFRWSSTRDVRRAYWLALTGDIVLGLFLAYLWLRLGRPPMQSLGETRLWYAFFLVIVGVLSYHKWKFSWFIPLSTLIALVFLLIDILRPGYFDKAMMPALQSPWFVPHVILFIFSYAILGVTALISLRELWFDLKKQRASEEALSAVDNLVTAGLSLFTVAMLFGALWAKEAWGHYWTWDPKETWALITWMAYKIFLHFRLHRPRARRAAFLVLFSAFLILLICWFGVNYLPSAITSVHTY